MQAARTAPRVGRQLLRLGCGRCVYAGRDRGSELGDPARTEPPTLHSSRPCSLLGQSQLCPARRPYANGATQVGDGGFGTVEE